MFVNGSTVIFGAVIMVPIHVILNFLLYSIDVRRVDIGQCDVRFMGGVTNPSVRISLSNIYIEVTGRYKKKVL